MQDVADAAAGSDQQSGAAPLLWRGRYARIPIRQGFERAKFRLGLHAIRIIRNNSGVSLAFLADLAQCVSALALVRSPLNSVDKDTQTRLPRILFVLAALVKAAAPDLSRH